MDYVSTRGGPLLPEEDRPAYFSDILLGGLAPDGGLTLCSSYPQVTSKQLDAWRHLPYAELAFEVMSLFITDIPAADLNGLLKAAYTPEIFCNGERAAEITPLRKLDDTLYLQALSNGPTLAFKDMAMQFWGRPFPMCWPSAVSGSTFWVRLRATRVPLPNTRCAASRM